MSDCALATLVEPLIKAVRERGSGLCMEVEVLPSEIDATALRVLQLRRDLVVLPLGYPVHGRAQRL